mmetsp:Transcript_6061/g.4583  ORF Transcript_6061/g.4583 Transcript_6061/m.4583 type:complete len:125 (+) Transcript_6061:90-464(+)
MEKPTIKAYQDMPPVGGYPQIATKRGIRPRGPSGFMIWGLFLLSTGIGYYRLSEASYESRMGRAENREARMAIIPFLRAEQDRKTAQMINEVRAQELEIMKDVEGFDVDKSVYSNSKRYRPPQL